jgi:ankyrin repeat protein
MRASKEGHTATVQALIEAGADVNLPNTDGCTALMMVSYFGHTATVQALVGAGADLDLQHKVSGGLLLLELRHSSRCGSCERWLNWRRLHVWGMVLSAGRVSVQCLLC